MAEENTQPELVLDPEDGGFASRKLLLILFGIVIIFIAALAPSPTLAANYPTLVGGVIGLSTLYVGGNVAHNMVVAKHVEATAPTPPTQVKKPAAPPKEVEGEAG